MLPICLCLRFLLKLWLEKYQTCAPVVFKRVPRTVQAKVMEQQEAEFAEANGTYLGRGKGKGPYAAKVSIKSTEEVECFTLLECLGPC